MPTVEHCYAMADEAERLAAIVSYARDKIRLAEQAKSWREKAKALEVSPPTVDVPPSKRPILVRWLRRRAA